MHGILPASVEEPQRPRSKIRFKRADIAVLKNSYNTIMRRN